MRIDQSQLGQILAQIYIIIIVSIRSAYNYYLSIIGSNCHESAMTMMAATEIDLSPIELPSGLLTMWNFVVRLSANN